MSSLVKNNKNCAKMIALYENIRLIIKSGLVTIAIIQMYNGCGCFF